ncbi:MAG: hypothetical protein KKA54_06150 [Proteobacteria bacterium]|nr:hypothetical protein [Pseudomonadota bacterium]MBU0965946.1 hypothetical protein [Pseudomonadota bacterium]
MMRKHKLKPYVCTVASTSLLLLSATAFNVMAEEEVANNLSVPLVFSEGYGLTGLPAFEKSGLPGGLTPTWGTPYEYNGVEYFLQATDSLWQAGWSADALLEEDPQPVSVTVNWSDDVINTKWNDMSVIPVGVTLYTDMPVGMTMTGYSMFTLPASILDQTLIAEKEDTSVVISSDEVVDEVFGTNQSTYETSTPNVYSICARLTIQKLTKDLDDEDVVLDLTWDPDAKRWTGDVEDEDPFNSAVYEGFGIHARPTWYTATIDGLGQIVYLYNWNLAQMQQGPDEDRSGWYRLTFSLDPVAEYNIYQGKYILKNKYTVDCNTSLDALDASDSPDAVLVSSSLTYVDIQITSENTGEDE